MVKQLQRKRAVFLFGIGLSMLLLLIGPSGFAQNLQIKGRVTSSDDGTALPGVSVRIQGTGKGTTTNADGNYSIAVPTGGTLTFTYTGYLIQEIQVSTTKVINVRLASEIKALQQVNVVSVGYGTQRRKDLTGSVASVSAQQIEQVPITTAEQALQGRASGVQIVNNDASPGGNVSVLIRGIGSLASGGNDPLYVVDGYPIAGGLNNVNPNDIASIDVLKDASATAIYGVRAANGVVIITTKHGRRDGVQVTLDAYTAFQSRPKTYHLLNAQEWASLANEVADADPQHNFVELPQWKDPNSLTNVDWQNAVYRPGLTQSYTLAIRGGNEKVQSATSLGYYDQKGIVLGSYFKRISLSSNVDYTPLKWLKSSTNLKYSYQQANNPFGTGSLVLLSQLPPTLDGGNKLTNLINDGNGNYGFYNPQNTYVSKYTNPVYTIENNRYSNVTNYLLANTSLEATILEGLRIKTNAGVNVNAFTGSFYQPQDDRSDQQYGLGGATQNALYSQHINQTFEWLWENTLSYDRTFGKHALSFVGGVSAQKNTWTGMGGQGIPPNSIIRDLAQVTNLQLDKNTLGQNNGNGQNIYALASQFARLTYKFDDRYLLTGTVRRDGSSKFEEGHQYGVFPSGAFAWRAKQEAFLKNVDWLSDLKLRASYGKVGNQGPIPLFQYQSLYSTGSAPTTSGNLGYPFGKTGGSNGTYQPGIASVQPENPNLRWETDYQTDFGLDLSFFNGELNFTADYFDRKSKDFLLQLAASPQTGYALLTQNVGSMRNKGLEFALNYTHKINDFRYGLGLTLTTVNNKLTSLTSGADFVTNFGGLTLPGIGWTTFTETHVGQPVGEFYGYKSLGIIQTQAQIDALNAQAAARNPSNPYYQKTATGPGDRLFADTNGDGQVTAEDQVSLGSPLPKFYGGFTVDLAWKNWDFNAYFYGVYGNKIFDYEESSLESFQNRSFVGVENVSYEYYLHHWTPSNPSNVYARANYNDDAIGSTVPSSAWIQNGSFLKLKNLTVGYTLPTELSKQLTLTKIRIYVSTQNLFTITSYKGLDPEVGVQGGNATQNGVDNGTYPSSKYYTIGLNVTF